MLDVNKNVVKIDCNKNIEFFTNIYFDLALNIANILKRVKAIT